ncbi:MAG: SDR family oxidoreductase [Crocinitomicaceae bacterium TMED209]|nr:MAG: SDR family oxidoreductase [Crocinitomicaceae bacterium TMED209]|tara:strand:+ start:4093 stop:4851 length:759 start_codon:yes stop_codon:yes gene_type:complete
MINYSFKNKNVLVTGSSKGIGLAIAKKFISSRANVILTGRSNLSDIKLTKKTNVNFFKGDLTNQNTIKLLYDFTVEKFKNSLDILVCNLGNGKYEAKMSYSEKEWQESFNLNFFSSIYTIQNFLKLLKKSEEPSIVCISSICAKSSLGCPIVYSSSKAALNNYVKNMSKLIGKLNIRINSISPGNIMFKNSTWEKKLNDNKKKVVRYIKNEVPLNKFGNPNNVADMVMYLSSSSANFTTGSNFVLDGGQTDS